MMDFDEWLKDTNGFSKEERNAMGIAWYTAQREAAKRCLKIANQYSSYYAMQYIVKDIEKEFL